MTYPMTRRPARAALALLAALLASAAAASQPVSAQAPAPLAFEPLHAPQARTPSGVFNSGMIFLADQLDRNTAASARARPTVITSFANLNDLNESSALGRLVGEHLMHELQVRAWEVVDVRMTRDLIINHAGEFSLSRDISHLREAFPLANVVTGTYAVTRDGVILNVRIIDSASGRVLSTAQTRLARDAFIAAMVDPPPAAPLVRLTGSCPSTQVCPTR